MTNRANLTTEELLAILLSREVRDFETSACGALSFIPAAGMLLARELHASDAELIILGSRDFVPFVTGKDFHFMAQRGQLDLFFISAIEIDREANFNLHVIGDRDAPDVLMPGQYGTGMLYYAVPRIVMFRTEHTRRTFVERVQFVSGAGTSPEGVTRRTKDVKVVTPMAVLQLNQKSRLLELASVHGGASVAEVRASTGFDLGAGGDVPATAPATDAEVEALRRVVRPYMVESGTYGELARTRIRDA